MPLRPIARRSVPDEVFDQLVADIVAGDLAPGEPLPPERRLAEVLRVSRPAIREALQRLAQANLVEIRQGGATTVRDFRRSAGLDLLPRLLLRDGGPDLAVVRSVLEARAALGPQVAAQCAERRTDEQAGRLRTLVTRLDERQEDLPALQDLAHELWDVVVDGTHNLVYRLLFNALSAAYLPVAGVLTEVMRDELTDFADYLALVSSIERRDAEGAATAAAALLDRGTARGLEMVEQLARDAEQGGPA